MPINDLACNVLLPGESKRSTMGIPVYLKTQSGKYLKLNSNRTGATLVDNKDQSTAMKWLLVGKEHIFEWISEIDNDGSVTTYEIQAANDNNEYIEGKTPHEVLSVNTANPAQVMVGDNNHTLTNFDISLIPESDGLYYIRNFLTFERNYSHKVSPSTFQYGGPEYLGYNGSAIEMRAETNRQAWEIEIAEEFDLVSLNWSTSPEVIVTTLPDFLQETTVVNSTSLTQSMTASFTKTATETSTFNQSKSYTLNGSFNTSFKIFGIGAGTSVSYTENTTWQFGTTEQKQDTRSYSFPISVPPHTTVVAKASVQMSKITADYVATFKGRYTKKTLKFAGKWEGVLVGMITYELRELNTNKLMKTFSGTPKSEVKL